MDYEINSLLFVQAVLVMFLVAGVMMVAIWLYYWRKSKKVKK